MRVPEDWQAFDKEMERIDGDVDPCESGEVLSCANLRLTAREKAAMEASTSDVRAHNPVYGPHIWSVSCILSEVIMRLLCSLSRLRHWSRCLLASARVRLL